MNVIKSISGKQNEQLTYDIKNTQNQKTSKETFGNTKLATQVWIWRTYLLNSYKKKTNAVRWFPYYTRLIYRTIEIPKNETLTYFVTN